MELVKILIIFVVILVLLNLKFPLYAGMLAGTALLLPLFQIGLPKAAEITLYSVTSAETLNMVLALYVISVLQLCLEKRDHLSRAQDAMNGLLSDQRLNTALASVFIGMMPAAPAVIICGDMMDNMAGDHLSPAEKACCASYYRHITEGVLPTFPLVIIVCTLSGIPVSSFFLTMLPMVAVLIVLGFVFYLHRVPKTAEGKSAPEYGSKGESAKVLLRSLWTIIASIAIILAFNVPAWLAVAVVVTVNIFTDRFSVAELLPIVRRAFDWKVVAGTFATFIFKDVLLNTGVVQLLPDYFSRLPIPVFLILALLFFFGSLVGSSNAVGAAFVPLAFNMMDGGVALLVLLMGFAYAASQMSPTHICLSLAAEHFDVSLTSMIGKIAPLMLCYMVILVGYYLLLTVIL